MSKTIVLPDIPVSVSWKAASAYIPSCRASGRWPIAFRPKNMRYMILAMLLSLQFLAALPADAQMGEAPPGCYPNNYFGATFSGAVTAADDASRTVTLTFTKGSKSGTFVGRLADGFSVKYADGTTKDLKPSDIEIGSAAIAFFTNYSEKVDGKKVDVHEIFMMRLKTSDGKEHSYKSHFDPKYKHWDGQGGAALTGNLDPCTFEKQ